MITALDAKTALVVIDLQKGILNKGKRAHPVDEILAKNAALIAAFRKANLPIVIVTVNPAGAKWTFSRKEGSPANVSDVPAQLPEAFTQVVATITTQPNDIFITKQTWNAFYNTPLHEELQQREITGIVLSGVATSIGVEGTARAASELGYNITFAADAMTDGHLEAHERSLHYIFPRMGEVGTTTEILQHLPQ
ncbi:MAG: hydrolase [Crocinitomicaceae bacterium]|nr:hydrolase [Crocinitomicaceae bacterium]|tara:strand:+ start:11575 stop:12156 length:582 start_codon:yes stop_codon:yes gene_type:complete